jgi:DHA1 family bicyclomycin/chloramphenicol resistance-like MFS transporter
VLPVCLYTFGMAIAMPSLSLLALELFPAQRGLASSCQSLLQMMVSASSAAFIAPLLWSSVGHMALGMAGALGLGALCFALSRRLHPQESHS